LIYLYLNTKNKLGCCDGFIKFLLFAFNVIFWLAGAAILGVGIYLLVSDDIHAVESLLSKDSFYTACYVLIAVGAFSFLVGFAGCCGAMKESQCLLGIYIFFLVAILICEVGVGIAAFVEKGSIETYIADQLNDKTPLKQNTENANLTITIENTFHCCGLVNGCEDWTNGETYGCGCDDTNDPNCVKISTVSNISCTAGDGSVNIYTESCNDALIDFVENNALIIGGVALGIGLSEIFGICFACVLCRNTRKNQYDAY